MSLLEFEFHNLFLFYFYRLLLSHNSGHKFDTLTQVDWGCFFITMVIFLICFYLFFMDYYDLMTWIVDLAC